MSEIWIDSSIPKDVAYALARVRKDISWVGDLYQFQRNKDPIWLPDAGKQNALVILRDKKVTTRPGERAAIMDNKVGAFVLTQNGARLQGLEAPVYLDGRFARGAASL